MRAAVVRDFQHPPAYGEFAEPPENADEVRISVRAAALSNLVRGQASGRHYSSKNPPFVPGVDGVGLTPDGNRVYFAFPHAPYGAMAEVASVDPALCVHVPHQIDDVTAAACANPGMSSMIALRYRARFERGESVLINGATGTAGRLAIGVARELGARTIIATGRDPAQLAELPGLGANIVLPLGGPPDEFVSTVRREMRAHGVSVVLDYLWGDPAKHIVAAIAGGGTRHAEPRIRFVNIGNSAGAAFDLPGGSLRSSGLELLGSGLGSVAYEDIVAGVRDFFTAFVHRKLSIDARAVPLADVEATWTDASAKDRVVFTLGG